MKYYLVALFDADSHTVVEKLQKNITRKYKLHQSHNLLNYHIMLEVIDDPDFEKLDMLIEKILKPYKKFKVEINNLLSFDPPNKSINLRIENKGYIIRLARNINDTLKLSGFNVRENTNAFDLLVPIANTSPSKHWAKDSHGINKESFNNPGCKLLAKIDRFELWKATNNRKRVLIKSYNLRRF